MCRRCLFLYIPYIDGLNDAAGVGRYARDGRGIDYAALECEQEEVQIAMRRAVQLSRLFRGVARAAGRLALARLRAAERTYAPGGAGWDEVRRNFAATVPVSGRLPGAQLSRPAHARPDPAPTLVCTGMWENKIRVNGVSRDDLETAHSRHRREMETALGWHKRRKCK